MRFDTVTNIHPPINTVMQPSVITPPWLVLSPILAAAMPPTTTVALPLIKE